MRDSRLGFACCPLEIVVDAKASGFNSPQFLTQVVRGNAAACGPCRFNLPPKCGDHLSQEHF